MISDATRYFWRYYNKFSFPAKDGVNVWNKQKMGGLLLTRINFNTKMDK